MGKITRTIERGVLIGIGAAAAAITRSQIEKHVKKLIKENKITAAEGRKVVNQLTKIAKQKQKVVEKAVRKEAHKRIKSGIRASRKALSKLDKKLAALEKKKLAKRKTTRRKATRRKPAAKRKTTRRKATRRRR